MYASKTTRGFYAPAIHGENMPADAVEITTEQHAALLVGQSQGRLIDFGDDGYPFLADQPPPPPLTLEQVHGQRQAAYAAESDPLKNEAEYDAIIAAAEPDYSAWLAKVAEIKARYPLPTE